MARILVTGASGRLGRLLVPRLIAGGHDVRAMSRQPRTSAHGETWIVADVETHDDVLTAATEGIDTLIHCASNLPTADATDISGTSNLLAAAEEAGVTHFFYVSIVGIEGVPLPYYSAKIAAEQAVLAAPLPWTILRTTQFHELLAEWLTWAADGGPAVIAEGARFRPVATSEVADRIAQLVDAGPGGRVRDLAGPEILSAQDLVERHAALTGKQVPITAAEPESMGAAFLTGAQIGEDCDLGSIPFGKG